MPLASSATLGTGSYDPAPAQDAATAPPSAAAGLLGTIVVGALFTGAASVLWKRPGKAGRNTRITLAIICLLLTATAIQLTP